MKIAFCLFKYFPYGGLQRDCLRIVTACRDKGHEVHIFTLEWQGEKEKGVVLHEIKIARAKQNHVKNQEFIQKVGSELKKQNFDLVFGFNKMPFLDYYFAADGCFKARVKEKHGFIYHLLPRYRTLLKQEKAVFACGKKTKILMLTKHEQALYEYFYHTEKERFHLLPPGIARDRMAPADAVSIRKNVRDRYHLTADDKLLLMVGSGFKTKGLDRTIYALSALSPALKARTQLFVLGQDNPSIFQKLANKLRVSEKIHFLGGRKDVADFLLAADILIHPAYHENAGLVLLEAMISGLPVLTMDVCGYAHYVKSANAGIVLHSPFQQLELNIALQKMLSSSMLSTWQKNGLLFGREADIYDLPHKVVNLIEQSG